MSREKGVLYHHGQNWSETESDLTPDHKWEGEIENGKPHGYGTYYVSNGATYVGYYKNGRRKGEGTFTWVDDNDAPNIGGKYVGEWRDNKRWNGTMYTLEGKIKSKYINGEIIVKPSLESSKITFEKI